MVPTRYRLRMSPVARVVRVVLLSVIAVVFVPGVISPGLDLWWRAVSSVGLVTAVLGARMMLGAVLVVRDEGLRLQKNWPHRRDIPWYRILASDVIPGFWNLELELNSGERVELPPVGDINALYADIERHRTALDA
jgi:hypothetical protein